MEQTRNIVEKTFEGIVKDSKKVAEITLRDNKDFVLIHLKNKISMLLVLKSGVRHDLSAISKNSYKQYHDYLKTNEKIILSILTVEKAETGNSVKYFWSISPSNSAVALALGLRIFGSFLWTEATVPSVLSMQSRYNSSVGSENGSLIECRDQVLHLPYEEDVRVLSVEEESDESSDVDVYTRLLKVILDSERREEELHLHGAHVMREFSNSFSAGSLPKTSCSTGSPVDASLMLARQKNYR